MKLDDENSQNVVTRVHNDALYQLAQLAKRLDTNRTQLIRRAIAEFLEEHAVKP